MIKHEAVVSVIHLEQRRAGEPAAIAVLHEAAANDAQVAAGIGKTDDGLLRDERLDPELKALYVGMRGLQFELGVQLGA